ncbi:hypothetical protein G9A89_018262 [Geosiphon pyriformis]|nr:hypothetical protein G9A89_018262 [Geosiphon pyriformis]
MKRRNFSNKISMHDGQSFHADNSSASPPKIPVDASEIFFLTQMARFANMGYCYPSAPGRIGSEKKNANFVLDLKNRSLIIYFTGPEIQESITSLEQLDTHDMVEGSILEYEWYADVQKLMLPIADVINKAGLTLNSKEIQLYLTGHGIGGVYAVFAALLLKEVFLTYSALETNNYLKLDFVVVTFGQPRLGNALFADYINRMLLIYRVTHSNDFIPNSMPLLPRDYLFKHHEREIWIVPKDCECPRQDFDQFELGYDVFKCFGYWPNAILKVGENMECNSGTDGRGTSVHFGPYFNTTFKDCREFLPG